MGLIATAAAPVLMQLRSAARAGLLAGANVGGSCRGEPVTIWRILFAEARMTPDPNDYDIFVDEPPPHAEISESADVGSRAANGHAASSVEEPPPPIEPLETIDPADWDG